MSATALRYQTGFANSIILSIENWERKNLTVLKYLKDGRMDGKTDLVIDACLRLEC